MLVLCDFLRTRAGNESRLPSSVLYVQTTPKHPEVAAFVVNSCSSYVTLALKPNRYSVEQ